MAARTGSVGSKLTLVKNELLCLLELAAAKAKDARGGEEEEEKEIREYATDDDVTLMYLASIAEDLSTSSGDPEDLDEEAFAETICAYVPPLSILDLATLREWIVGVARKLDGMSSGSCEQQSLPAIQLGPSALAVGASTTSESETHSPVAAGGLGVAAGEACCAGGGKQSEHLQGDAEAVDERVALLLEMFGGMCSLSAIQKCLRRAGGDVDRAVQELLECSNGEDETNITDEITGIRNGGMAGSGTSPEPAAAPFAARGRDERLLKASILSRYGYVAADGGGGSTGHQCLKPITSEEKKLIRYRDGQVVSTKGERYMDVKKQETEEMKKTYISLKPLKKYRWH